MKALMKVTMKVVVKMNLKMIKIKNQFKFKNKKIRQLLVQMQIKGKYIKMIKRKLSEYANSQYKSVSSKPTTMKPLPKIKKNLHVKFDSFYFQISYVTNGLLSINFTGFYGFFHFKKL